MSARIRCQRSYDHRLKEPVRISGDSSLAIDLGVPASTLMGWLCDSPPQVVTIDVLSMKEQQLQHEVLMLRRRIRKLLSLLRLFLVLRRITGFSLAHERVPKGRAKAALLRAIDRLHNFSKSLETRGYGVFRVDRLLPRGSTVNLCDCGDISTKQEDMCEVLPGKMLQIHSGIIPSSSISVPTINITFSITTGSVEQRTHAYFGEIDSLHSGLTF
jgi:hypothetical protein